MRTLAVVLNGHRLGGYDMQHQRTASTQDRIVRESECAKLTGLSRTRRWELEQAGSFPRRRKLSERASGWLLSEIQAWVESRPLAK